MKLMAVICEYNPFHKGHEYQLKTQKNRLSADGVICLMSGSFVQRGAPAVYDKWTRAKAAILSGADLVLELPVVYSAQSAKRFSFGAVSLLNALGCVDALSFGSECDNLSQLQQTKDLVFSSEFLSLVADEMKHGISFPAARSVVMQHHFPTFEAVQLDSPNNILALEYLKALEELQSSIEPTTLHRDAHFASASAIREKMACGQSVANLVPASAQLGKMHYSQQAFDQLVLYQFRKETPESLRKIADVAEGLEHRILKYAKTCFSANDLAEQVKTKRYTRTRIDRIIVNTLLGITDCDTELAPQYARVLAFNQRGTKVLNQMADTSKIPLITKMADATPTNSDFARMLEKDLLATDIYALLTEHKYAGQDFTISPIYIK